MVQETSIGAVNAGKARRQACGLGALGCCVGYYRLKPGAAATTTILALSLMATGFFFAHAAANPTRFPKLQLSKAGRTALAVTLPVLGATTLALPAIIGGAVGSCMAKAALADA